jgi:hypothetical protein
MGNDRGEIVTRVRRVPEALMAATGHDLRAPAERLRCEQASSGYDVVSRPPRTTDENPDRVS